MLDLAAVPAESELAEADPAVAQEESVVEASAVLGLVVDVPVLALVASAELAALVVLVSVRVALRLVELESVVVLAFVRARHSLVAWRWVLVVPPCAGAVETSGTLIPDWLLAGLVRHFGRSPGRRSRTGVGTERMPQSRCTTTMARPWSMKGTLFM